jgi:hypothetical protein
MRQLEKIPLYCLEVLSLAREHVAEQHVALAVEAHQTYLFDRT